MALIDSIVSYWKFDVDSNTQVDSHASNDGIVSGTPPATFTASGKINGAYDFPGEASTTTIAVTHDFGNVPISVSAWIKRADGVSVHNIMLAVTNDGWAFYIRGSQNDLTFGEVGVSEQPSTLLITDTDWHFVAVTYDGTDLKFYVDGSTNTQSWAGRTFSASTVYGIGSRAGVGVSKGLIDEVAVWNKVLSPSEIIELYNSGVGFSYPFVDPPVAAFSADDVDVSTGATVNFTDSSSNNPTSWSWIFESGSPATSSDQNPSIVYDVVGLFDVSLTATNAGGSDDEVKVDYITVTANYVEAKRKELKTDYPFEKGLTARTQSQTGRVMNLVPQTSLIPKRLKVGFR